MLLMSFPLHCAHTVMQLGSLLKRDKTRALADVQLLRDRDRIERLDYDDICEYAGNVHDEDDY